MFVTEGTGRELSFTGPGDELSFLDLWLVYFCRGLSESQGATLNADEMSHFKRGVGGSLERASNKTRSVFIDVFA